MVHLLTLAKHPETIALLQGALEEAQNPSSQQAQNDGSAMAQEMPDRESKLVESKVQSTTKSARPSRERTAFSAKINEYGELALAVCEVINICVTVTHSLLNPSI